MPLEERGENNQRIKKTVVFFVVAAVFLFISHVRAQEAPPPAGGLETGLSYAQATGLADADIRVIIAKIIRVFLGLLGIIAVGFTIYGGWMYMTSAGNEEKVSTAKNILKNMAIGLAIILSAYSITQFVITSLYNSYYGQVTEGGGAGAGDGGTAFYLGSSGLGTVIESHYPGQDAPQTGEPPIPRNISIIITFKPKMVASTLVADTNANQIFGDAPAGLPPDQINSANVKIFATDNGISNALSDVSAVFGADGKTLALTPKNLLGNAVSDTNYTVRLTNGVIIDDGTAAGKTAFDKIGGYYEWRFTVSTFEDRTPPTVTGFGPALNSSQPRNYTIQINFSEPVNPVSVSNLNNLTVVAGAPVAGAFKISNNYQTVEFTPSALCEQKNACGADMFCLPGRAAITVLARTATLTPATADSPFQAALLDGVVDTASNALDGNKNGEANGPPADNFSWQFSTTAGTDISSPEIINISPRVSEEEVSPTTPIRIGFSKPMSISSFSNLLLKTSHGPIGYEKRAENLIQNGEITRTTAIINHVPFLLSSVTP